MGAKKAVPQDWTTLLDELKQQESLTSDAKLAALLGVTRGYICSVRKGRSNVSLELGKKIFSRLSRTFDVIALEHLFVPNTVRRHTANLLAVRDNIISRAKGHCQLCGAPAPFSDAEGRPYLEIRHLIPLHQGGNDSLDNLVALCPNCDAKLTISPSISDQKKLQRLAARHGEA